jgi:hypothetical protein
MVSTVNKKQNLYNPPPKSNMIRVKENVALPINAHPPAPVKPSGARSGPPRKQPIFPTAGHFDVNVQGNIVRKSASGQAPVLPLTPFQGAHPAHGNEPVHYSQRVGVAQQVPTIKKAGVSILAMSPLPGNDKRRAPQPVNTVLPFDRATQNGGQAYLPIYKRKKMGRSG